MDRPHLPKQGAELYGPGRPLAAGGKLCTRDSHNQLSQQPRRRNGDIRSKQLQAFHQQMEAATTPENPNNMEVEMKIRGLMMDPVTNMPIVVLKDVGSETVLPIWVGV